MAGSLRRFLHLERARPAGPSAAAPDARARFAALEVTRALPEASVAQPTAAADRFREPPAAGLALERPSEEEQPFVRCASCEADHPRRTACCTRCGATLESPEQRAFNEILWARLRREADEERRVAEARRQARQREDEEEARTRRALAEAMAQEILQRERERLGEPWIVRAVRRLRALFPES